MAEELRGGDRGEREEEEDAPEREKKERKAEAGSLSHDPYR